MSDSASTHLEILLELSHTAVIKEKPVVKDGVAHTHDWHLQVKASNGGNCENYLEKVVFSLHHTIPNHTLMLSSLVNRMVNKPPFEMRESGYGRGFTVPIDLYFKTPNNRFRKTRVNYDLVLQPNTDAGIPIDPHCERQIKMTRTEKFTFPILDKGFRKRILCGGGKLVDLPLPLERNSSSTYSKESGSKAEGSMDRIINKHPEEENRRRGKHKHKKSKRKSRESRERHSSIEEKGVEYTEEESEKDLKTSGIMDQVGLEMEVQIKEENVRPKQATYCLLCQEYGHVLSDDCVVNATCLSCGVKGHVRRDCYCLLCQEYGHVLNEDCTTCFNCGMKGHVRRDCSSVHQFKGGSQMNNNRKRPPKRYRDAS